MNSLLEKFAADLRAEEISPAALFWLRVFIKNARDGILRSDEWVERGLTEGATVPGLDATDAAARLALLSNYDLFQAERLKDQHQFTGPELATLDWNRKYNLSLRVAENGSTLMTWVETLWSEVGVSPQARALEKLLSGDHSIWGHNLPKRSLLPEILHEAQTIYGGWLPRHVLTRIAHALDLPLSDVYGVTEFFTMYYTQPVGKKIIRICEDAPCAMRGSQKVQDMVCWHLGIDPGQTTEDGEFTIEPIRCLGLCDHAPAALVNDTRHFDLSAHYIEPLLTNRPHHDQHSNKIGGLVKVAMANVNVIDPYRLPEYQAQGGLAALRKALFDMTPEQVIEAVKASKLVGRGGAAFPTGLKWQFTAANPPGPRYIICNADESEVGAFKDRTLMDADPFRVLEGLLIACYAVGAEQGFVYVRGEHRLSYERFVHAIGQLQRAGWLGHNIKGSGFTCRLAVRRGAGAYVCGEETALMEAIEGKRGFPRLRPPYPTTHGLWGRPTVINNVETLAKVPSIIFHGGAWYSTLGTADSAGTKLFAVSGSVRRPGVYEIPFGVTLRQLVYDLAGGILNDRPVQGVLTGGAAGTFLTADHLDTPITFEDFKKIGGTIGAGTMMVFDDSIDMRDVLTRVGEFFAHESCGKCYPCQIGTQRQAEILHRIQHGESRPEDIDTLLELAQVMTDTSICGLGQSAGWAVTDAIKRWPELLKTGDRG
ncbi:MAG TPA: NAD(P)H-dependent oxidoreductase subunit E [Anaerolineae bacterium]|nr:NAD(P)H-dependent oxidoreductase subunit E [Anaerolineae bacterium]